MFSDRLERIQPSATLEMTAKAADLKREGKDVINLSVGEPDFNTPKNIQDAGIHAIQNGITRYTPGGGTLDLKEAIQFKLLRDNNLEYSTDQIVVSCGGKHSLYNACQVLFQRNDEVIVFTPYWVSFPDFISVTGAKPVFVNTLPENQNEPDFNDLKSKINSNTKGIIINSPSNPTGGVWSNDALLQAIKIARQHDLWIFSDECYEQLTYDKEFTSTAFLDKDFKKIVTFQSCSKTYAMTGWRIGYIAGDKNLIKAVAKLQGQSTSCPTSISQHAAIEALRGSQEAVKKMKKKFHERRDFIVAKLNNMDNVSCQLPRGAFYVFPDFSYFIGKSLNGKTISSASDIALGLLSKYFVVSVAGNSFGSDHNIRFSYALSKHDLHKAMNLLERFLQKIN
ncbi:MAG: hypothetical protein CBD58_02710 [bacterium TMED198]|nr:MAG: hypothetical protein CBD58_02710 [bacterium TMED198]